jgi:Undecaprenyl-phosphate galactose phosphotransferase WbaP
MSAAAQRTPAAIQSSARRYRAAVSLTLYLVIADILAVECALWLGCLLRSIFESWIPIVIRPPQYETLCFGVLTLPLGYYCMGLYRGYGIGPVQRLRNRVYSTLLIFSVLLVWNSLYEQHQWSRGILVGSMLFSLILTPIFEAAARALLVKFGTWGTPAIILGGDRCGCLVLEKLQKERAIGLVPIAVLDDDPRKWGTTIHGVPVAGPLALARDYCEHAKVAIVAMPGIDCDRLLQLVHGLAFPSVIVVPDLVGVQTLWTVSRDLGGVLGIELRNNLRVKRNRVIKLCLDYAIAAPLCIFTAPVVAICAACVKLSSPGPAFFRQEREGAGGRRISIWKLRTMHVDAERLLIEHLDSDPQEKDLWFKYYKLKKDPRVIPLVGSFLRKSSLDELPQLWNVLAGHMSLVGPRPFPQYHLKSFPEVFRDLRRSVAPGITGLWQVSERSDGDVAVQQAIDTYYIRNWSVWLDIHILARTVRTVLMPKGAY